MAQKLKPIGDIKSKTCSKCGVPKILSAYDKDASTKDGYKSACMSCRRDYDKKKRKEGYDGEYPMHLWRGGNVCMRCSLERFREAHPFKVGQWINTYLVDGEWIKAKPKCVVTKLV